MLLIILMYTGNQIVLNYILFSGKGIFLVLRMQLPCGFNCKVRPFISLMMCVSRSEIGLAVSASDIDFYQL
jgi:hypothetical protein